MKKIYTILVAFVLSTPAIAWDGYDYDEGSFVSIDRGELVREGYDIEYYDYGSGEYRSASVETISDSELEVYDYESGEYRYFDMD